MQNSPKIQGWRSERTSFFISLLTHSLIIALLVAFGFFSSRQTGGEPRDRPGGIVLAQFDNNQTEYLDRESDVTDLDAVDTSESNDAQNASADTAAAAEAPDIEIPEDLDLPGVQANPALEFDANNMSQVAPKSSKPVKVELSDKDLERIAKDQRAFAAARPKGAPTTINIFGSGGLTGHRFVFVIDRSHSMGGEGLGVLTQARKELINAVEKLESNHEFQIVAYHDTTVTISQRKLLPATVENKKKVSLFFENIGAFGATNHYFGLQAALSFQPDIIVFMTDGGSPGLSPYQRDQINKYARKRGTQIHCIQFGSGALQQNRNFMTRLAADHQGTFRYINVNNWRSSK